MSDSGAASNGYEMVGIPDGMGARRVGGQAELFMNQELRDTQGVVRAHGQKGAFVSQYTIDPATDEVVAGADLIQPGIEFYDYLTDTYGATPNGAGANATTTNVFPAYSSVFSRFCSGSLTDPYQLANFATCEGLARAGLLRQRGERQRGSRIRRDYRTAWPSSCPASACSSWENHLAAKNHTDTTVVIGNEDCGRRPALGVPGHEAGHR